MEHESNRELLLRYARTVLGGILLGIGCVCAYAFCYGVAHKIFQPLMLFIAVPSFFSAGQLAKHDLNGPFLGLAMASLNTTFMALALMFILHPESIENLAALSIFQQGLVATVLFCIPLGMALIFLDFVRLSRQENRPAGR